MDSRAFLRRALRLHGTDHDSGRCRRFQGFIYGHARFTLGKKTIEILAAAAQVFGRDLLAPPAPGFDQLASLLRGRVIASGHIMVKSQDFIGDPNGVEYRTPFFASKY
jgi:hypothetical protein